MDLGFGIWQVLLDNTTRDTVEQWKDQEECFNGFRPSQILIKVIVGVITGVIVVVGVGLNVTS